MEPQALSSNWKQLKQKLQVDPTASRKRKASAALPSSNSNSTTTKEARPTKRAKATGIRKMGHLLSRPAHSSPTTSTNNPSAHSSKTSLRLSKTHSSTSNPTQTPSSLPAALTNPTLHLPSDSLNAGLTPNLQPGRFVAIDCEMVGVGPPPAYESALARVSLVDFHGTQLYDSFVQPRESVTDYRTAVSGITPALLRDARSLETVQAEVGALLAGRVLVGHAVRHDLDALMLGHPRRDIRDTSRLPRFRAVSNGRTPGLRRLAKEILGIEIQAGEHSSVEDARATMALFRREKEEFERENRVRFGEKGRGKGGADAGKEKPVDGMAATAAAGAKKKKKKKKKGKK